VGARAVEPTLDNVLADDAHARLAAEEYIARGERGRALGAS
jgi:hypothetical protein